MSANEGQLLERASQLQAEVSWVREYYQRWDRIRRLCLAQLNMCHENKKGDPYAIDALTTTIALAETKAEKCKAWLLEKEPQLAAINREVFIDE